MLRGYSSYALEPQLYTWKNALLWGNCREHGKKAFASGISNGRRIVHLAIAAIEAIPLIGQIASVFEKLIMSRALKQPNPQRGNTNQPNGAASPNQTPPVNAVNLISDPQAWANNESTDATTAESHWVDSLDDVVACDRVENPRLMVPCGHMFGLENVNGLLLSSRSNAPPCPTCRVPIVDNRESPELNRLIVEGDSIVKDIKKLAAAVEQAKRGNKAAALDTKKLELYQVEAPQVLVPCGHVDSLKNAETRFGKKTSASAVLSGSCQECANHVINYMKSTDLNKVIEQRNKLVSHYTKLACKAEYLKAGGAPVVPASAPVAEEPIPVGEYPGKSSEFTCSRHWSPLNEREKADQEYAGQNWRMAFKDRSQQGILSYIRVMGFTDGHIEIYLASSRKDDFEKYLKERKLSLDPISGKVTNAIDGEGNPVIEGRKTKDSAGRTVPMGIFIARTKEELKWAANFIVCNNAFLDHHAGEYQDSNLLSDLILTEDNWSSVTANHEEFIANGITMNRKEERIERLNAMAINAAQQPQAVRV